MLCGGGSGVSQVFGHTLANRYIFASRKSDTRARKMVEKIGLDWSGEVPIPW